MPLLSQSASSLNFGRVCSNSKTVLNVHLSSVHLVVLPISEISRQVQTEEDRHDVQYSIIRTRRSSRNDTQMCGSGDVDAVRCVVYEVGCGVYAVVEAGGEGVFGRETVADGYSGELVCVCDVLEDLVGAGR